MIGVTWYESLAFVRWVTDETHRKGLAPEAWKVRLPSEAEWEKAARGGTEVVRKPLLLSLAELTVNSHEAVAQRNPEPRRDYPWGESEGSDESDANRANYCDTGIEATSSVGCFPAGASPCGCEDLSGNVWEWTRSLYASYPYDGADGREKLEAPPSESRVLRGGSFAFDRDVVRCAFRYWDLPFVRLSFIGFRLCSSPF